MLITARDSLMAQALRSHRSLDVMTSEQAIELLNKLLRRSVIGAERDQALALAEEVGYLPLALELTAAQVADGVPWAELLEDLRAEVAQLEALDLPGADEAVHEATHKRLSLRASFHLSLRRLSDEKRRNFAWLGVLPERSL